MPTLLPLLPQAVWAECIDPLDFIITDPSDAFMRSTDFCI